MKTIIIILMSIIALSSCGGDKTTPVKNKQNVDVQASVVVDSEGYELMKQNCFVCHMEKPDPSKKGQMVAPPMMRVQEHYKPSYPDKKEFVEAIKKWVSNPSEDKVMMPGAVRKFNLMPKLALAEADLQSIAEVLYDIDFGNMPKMHSPKDNKLTLNDGKKWVLNKNSKEIIARINKQLKDFQSTDVSAYNQLGKDVFDNAKIVLLDKSYDDNISAEIQKFFHAIEGDMHNLMAASTVEEANEEHGILIDKFEKLNQFFE